MARNQEAVSLAEVLGRPVVRVCPVHVLEVVHPGERLMAVRLGAPHQEVPLEVRRRAYPAGVLGASDVRLFRRAYRAAPL